MTDIPLQIAIRAMAAEEALSSCEIEGIQLSPRDRFITKCKMIWPSLFEEDLCAVFDHMMKEKAA